MFIVKIKAEIIKLWKCPKCGRQFKRENQSHSCKNFPLEQHFYRKEKGKMLYEKFRMAVKNQLGSFKIESLECCIHFVSISTFVAIKIFKDKIRIDFSLDHKIDNNQIKKYIQMSANRYLYDVDITNEDEIDGKLMEWIQEAFNKK